MLQYHIPTCKGGPVPPVSRITVFANAVFSPLHYHRYSSLNGYGSANICCGTPPTLPPPPPPPLHPCWFKQSCPRKVGYNERYLCPQGDLGVTTEQKRQLREMRDRGRDIILESRAALTVSKDMADEYAQEFPPAELLRRIEQLLNPFADLLLDDDQTLECLRLGYHPLYPHLPLTVSFLHRLKACQKACQILSNSIPLPFPRWLASPPPPIPITPFPRRTTCQC